MASSNSLKLLVPCALLFALCGCVQQSSDGTTTAFTYQLWVPLSVLIGGLVATPAGWYLRNESRFGIVLLLLGPIMVVLFAPSLFRDKATISEDGYHLRTGFWGLTAVHDVRFEDLQQVRIESEEVSGRRGRKRTNYYMLCLRSDGSSAKIPLGNKVAEASAPLFLRAATAFGIPVVDNTRF